MPDVATSVLSFNAASRNARLPLSSENDRVALVVDRLRLLTMI
ncbi:hypothetical protein [Chroococcidiopsis sp [FACHB-1243]]|nr:hypothetical protein [Chroococcidiopsis sp. [FACHB-1243]]